MLSQGHERTLLHLHRDEEASYIHCFFLCCQFRVYRFFEENVLSKCLIKLPVLKHIQHCNFLKFNYRNNHIY